MSKLHDQETLNLGQLRLVVREVYQESSPPAKIREWRLLELIYAGRPHINVIVLHIRAGRPPQPLDCLSATAQDCVKAEPHLSDHCTAKPAPRQQKGLGVHRSHHESPPGSNDVIGHSDAGLQ